MELKISNKAFYNLYNCEFLLITSNLNIYEWRPVQAFEFRVVQDIHAKLKIAEM